MAWCENGICLVAQTVLPPCHATLSLPATNNNHCSRSISSRVELFVHFWASHIQTDVNGEAITCSFHSARAFADFLPSGTFSTPEREIVYTTTALSLHFTSPICTGFPTANALCHNYRIFSNVAATLSNKFAPHLRRSHISLHTPANSPNKHIAVTWPMVIS